jgi:hypothetical protein
MALLRPVLQDVSDLVALDAMEAPLPANRAEVLT